MTRPSAWRLIFEEKCTNRSIRTKCPREAAAQLTTVTMAYQRTKIPKHLSNAAGTMKCSASSSGCATVAQEAWAKIDQIRSLAPQPVRPRRARFCKLIEDLGDVHATPGLAKFRYVEIQARRFPPSGSSVESDS